MENGMSEVLSLAEAERLAERVLHDIGMSVMAGELRGNERALAIRLDHRERVASDLAGLGRALFLAAQAREVGRGWTPWEVEAQDRSDNLRRTARLYGVQEATS